MGFKPRKEADKHKVADGDTLESIAAKAGVSEEELTSFNWGTKEDKEISRAMVEVVGCQKVDTDGETILFSGTDASRGTGEVLLPKKYEKSGLATTQTHVLTIKKPKPMPAVSILKLDKWFIPGPADKGGEACRIDYALEGIKERADKVCMEVYASNYCSASVDNKGIATYTAIKDAEPVYEEDLAADKCKPRSSHDIKEWTGKSTAKSGMLKPAAGKDRYLNVAFSPYTVHLRFYKSGGDKEALLRLYDFWPQWDEGGVIKPAALKVRWKVEKCSKLKHGQLLVFDKTDKVVFRLGLKKDVLSEGEQSYSWDGKLTDGTFIKREQMPYRVQIQAHTDMDEDDGVALAAMHTEVRLFVHKDTGKNLIKEAYKDPNSLELGLAPFVPKEPEEGDEIKWYQHKLAEGGFHPGPIDGDHGRLTRRALREFQRSNPANTAAPFARLQASGTRNNPSKDALKRLNAETRPIFGDPANQNDLSNVDGASRLTKNDHAQGLILWVDDRHCYTEANPGRPFLDSMMFMDDYHGGMSEGDGVVAKNKDAMARPWIPVQADLPLRPRDGSNDGLASEDKKVDDVTRGAIGPLRLDWRVEEWGEDLSVIDQGHANYDTSTIRSSKWVDEATKADEATFEGKKHRNCPEDGNKGGVRPADMSTYQEKAFGHDKLNLDPWVAKNDPATKGICTIVHDDQGQDADKLFDTHVGRAGVFLYPSRVGGDGYRFSAKVRFDKPPAGLNLFPNFEVLERRYAKLPKAHTCKMRVWHKTSYRGYAAWCPAADTHWPAHKDPCAEFYEAAFLKFVDEPGPNPAAAYVYNIGGNVSAAEYRTCVTTNVTHADFTGLTIAFKLDRVWPYCDEPHLGIPQGGPGTDLGNFRSRVVNGIFTPTWRSYRKDLLHLLLSKIERNTGRLRGHLLVEFKSSQALTIEEYRCSEAACPAKRSEVTTNCAAGDLLVGSACPQAGCAGTMIRHTPPRTRNWNSIPLPAVGVSMGATWLFTSGGPDVWAHELGHHRHLEHAQANPDTNGTAHPHNLGRSVWHGGAWHRCGAAPGAKANQHDSVPNPSWSWVAALDPIHPDKDRCWDRNCIMSYTHGEVLYFCGKCLMKNRGWAVEGLPNPGGAVHD